MRSTRALKNKRITHRLWIILPYREGYTLYSNGVSDKIPTPNFDAVDPRQCLNAKLRTLHRLINSAYQSEINPYGLRGSMLSILFIVRKNQGINQKAIAELFVLVQSTMSRDQANLVKRDLIQKEKSPSDPRIRELMMPNDGYRRWRRLPRFGRDFIKWLKHYSVVTKFHRSIILQKQSGKRYPC